jgi:hypothetical protein
MREVIGIIDMRAAEGRADEVVAAFAACITQYAPGGGLPD